MEEIEIWKDIGVYKGVDFTGYFEVSTLGNIRSLDRWITTKDGKKCFYKGETRKLFLNPFGYLQLTLNKGCQHKTVKVHRLVMDTFKPNPNPEIYTQVNHIGEKHDFEKRNEHEDWCTYYKRDRGEDGVDPQWLSPSKFWGDSGEEYNYLFKVETGKWYYRCYDSGRWKVLTDEVCEITKEDKEQAEKEIVEHNKKNQHKDIDKMLDDFLAKF